jgi:PAS domain S-box-containing protein
MKNGLYSGMSPSLRQFMIISIVGMTVLLMSLLYFHVDLSKGYLEAHLDTHNKNLAIVLRNSLLSEGLANVLTHEKDKLSEESLNHITTILDQELRWVPVVKVKIYNRDAAVLYSSKAEEIGQSAQHNSAVASSLVGTAVSDVVYRDLLNKMDNVVESRPLHQQYIPVSNHQNGEILGVFEIYTDITALLADVENKQSFVFWSIGIILVMFYIAIALSFLKNNRLLQTEQRQRQAHLNELNTIRAGLEERVQERTVELQNSKKFLQSVIDGIGNPLLVIRPDFTIALMNNAARNLIPADQDSDDYKYCYQVSHRNDQPCHEPDHPCSFSQVMQQGCASRVRHTHYDANNKPILVDVVSTPLYSADGKFEGVIEVEHDITLLVEMQAGLQKSEARLQGIMANVPDAILTCDKDCVIQSVNSSAQKLFNTSEAKLVGESFYSFFSDATSQARFKAARTGQIVTMLKRIDGEEFPAEIWIGPLDLNEKEDSFIAVVRNISKRLQAQKELEKTRQQYFHQEKMAAIGQLAAGILHEVGNPIAAIAGAASDLKSVTDAEQLLDEKLMKETVNANIQLINEQTTRLGKITREIADFASPRPRERELLDLNSLINSTARLLAYDQRFREIKMDLELDRNLPAITGVADQLTQVLMNLLLNAMDASLSAQNAKTHILIKTELRGERVLVSVEDFGIGMSSENLSHVLEPFFTTKPVGKGSGLGLSLCDTIVLAHGGELTIDSEEGRGTRVQVSLPVDSMDEADTAVDDDSKNIAAH